MKGIVFTEFLDLVEDKFGLRVIDKMETKSKWCNTTSHGIYKHKSLKILQLHQYFTATVNLVLEKDKDNRTEINFLIIKN